MSTSNPDPLLPSIPKPDDHVLNKLQGTDPDWVTKVQDQTVVTEEQWQELDQFFEINGAGPVTQSILCKDDTPGNPCPWLTACPLYRAKIPRPLNRACPIEETFKVQWLAQLKSEIGSMPDGFAQIDMGVIVDLMNTMLDIHRAQSELVDMPNIAERVTNGFDKEGNPMVDLRMNPVIFGLKNLREMKQKLLKGLVLTREARAKDSSRQTQDGAQLIANMTQALQQLGGVPQRVPQAIDLPLQEKHISNYDELEDEPDNDEDLFGDDFCEAKGGE